LGRAAEARNDATAAVTQYENALLALQTTTDWTGYWRTLSRDAFFPSFAHERLTRLDGEQRGSQLGGPHFEAALRGDLRTFWLARGEQAEADGRFADAYRAYFRAGWDDYFTNDMDDILDRLVRTAEAAGFVALARIARLHRSNLF
jgi:hypothetical protein